MDAAAAKYIGAGLACFALIGAGLRSWQRRRREQTGEPPPAAPPGAAVATATDGGSPGTGVVERMG